MTILPSEFQARMKQILAADFEEFLREYQKSHRRALRVNTIKANKKQIEECIPILPEPSPFSPNSFYLPEEVQGLGKHPLHHAGAFYLQEPSASSAVTILSPEPGDNVLDLCAAPGGKSTQIGALLGGKGLLWSNEVVKNRARALLSNIERLGIRNAVVSSCRPEQLCAGLAGFFDKVLVDAPCSGEGMFRREPDAVQEWSIAHVQTCAVRQLAILHTAAQALKEGGVLVYSTCTFSPEENEQVIAAFLKEETGFILEECGVAFGRPGNPSLADGNPELRKTRRIYPMDGGEGHFIAKLRRVSANPTHPDPLDLKNIQRDHAILELYSLLSKEAVYGTPVRLRDTALLLPEGLPKLDGLGILRAGVQIGEYKKGRIEPAHAFFMAASPEMLPQRLDFSWEDPRLLAYLRGEEVETEKKLSGFVGISVQGILTGFGKCSGGRIKNRYPKGLRNLK